MLLGVFTLTFLKQVAIKRATGLKLLQHWDSIRESVFSGPTEFLRNLTSLLLLSTRLVFFSVTPSDDQTSDPYVVIALGTMWTSCCQRIFNTNTRLWEKGSVSSRETRCSGIRAGRSLSSEPQFPRECNKGLWWSWSRRSPLPRSLFQAGPGSEPPTAGPPHLRPLGPRRLQRRGSPGPNAAGRTRPPPTPSPTSGRHLYLSR